MDQTILLRRMSGKARIEQAFKRSNLVRELALKNIQEGKRLTNIQALRELRLRISHGESYAR
jgi:hypothetical protein